MGAVRGTQRPVGVGPVEAAVLVDHLRLHPDAEVHAQGLDALDQRGQPAGEFFLVDAPVAQPGAVVVPRAEPAVVQDEQVHAQPGGLPGQVHQLAGVKIKIGGLPAVDEHRPVELSPGGAEQMGPDGPVELAAHLPEAGGGAHQRGLRSGERPAGFQGPTELPGVYPQHQTAVFKLAALRRRLKIAAVQQHGAPAKAVVLPRVPLAQHDEGVVLVAGRPPHAAHALHAGAQRRAVQTALHGVPPVKGDEIQITPLEVQAEGGCLEEADRGAAPVYHPDGPGDEVVPLEHAIVELHRQAGGGVR